MACTRPWFLVVPLLALAWMQGVRAAHAPVWEPLTTIESAAPPSTQDVDAVSLRLPLYNFGDFIYYFKMQIGTPLQTVRVVFDTASSDIGIATIKSGAHRYYNHSRSSTYKPDGRAATFRDGMEGGLVQDRLGLLGDDVAANQPFVEITNVSSYGSDYVDMPFDGWFGLGRNETQSVGGFPTFVRTLATLGVLNRPCVEVSAPSGTNGQIVFGRVNELGREHSVVPTDPHPGLWGFNVGAIKVGNTSIQVPDIATTNGTEPTTTPLGFAALDNTRPYIVGPPDAVLEIAKLVNAMAFTSGLFSVPCDAKLPDISFWSATTPADEVFTLTASELMGPRVGKDDCMFYIAQRLRGDIHEVADWAMGAPVFHRYNFGFCWSKIPGAAAPVLTKALHN